MSLKGIFAVSGVALITGAGLVAGALNAQADSTATANMQNQSTTVQKSFYDQLSDHGTINLFSIYRGGSLTGLGDAYQPDLKGNADPTSPQSVESYLNVAWKPDADTQIGSTLHFFYYPSYHTQGLGTNSVTGGDMQMLDPALMLRRNNIINKNGFKLTGMFYVNFPFTAMDRLQHDGDVLSFQPTYNLTYDVPHTRLTLAAYGYWIYYVPGSDQIPLARTYKWYIAPNASYQLTDKVAATVWVDAIQVTRKQGVGNVISGADNYPWDIEPGFSWDITKNITLNPFLNIYPETPTLAATSLQAVLIAKAF